MQKWNIQRSQEDASHKISHLLITAARNLPPLEAIWHFPPWSYKWNDKSQVGVSYTSALFSPSTIHLGLRDWAQHLVQHKPNYCVWVHCTPEWQELPGPDLTIWWGWWMLCLWFHLCESEHRGEKSGQMKTQESSWKNLKLQKVKTLQKDGFCFSSASSGEICFLLCSSAKCCYVCEFNSVV